MIIFCSKCGAKFESLIIDKDTAYMEVLNASVKHVRNSHRSMCDEMNKAIAASMSALTTFMHFSEFVVVPETETRVVGAIDQAQEIVMAALGYDPEEDPEEDDTPNDDDGLDDPQVGTVEVTEEEDSKPKVEEVA